MEHFSNSAIIRAEMIRATLATAPAVEGLADELALTPCDVRGILQEALACFGPSTTRISELIPSWIRSSAAGRSNADTLGLLPDRRRGSD